MLSYFHVPVDFEFRLRLLTDRRRSEFCKDSTSEEICYINHLNPVPSLDFSTYDYVSYWLTPYPN